MKKIKFKFKKKVKEEPKEEPVVEEYQNLPSKTMCNRVSTCKGRKYNCPHSEPHDHIDTCNTECSLLNSIDKSFKCVMCKE